jgi:hypothetical protein
MKSIATAILVGGFVVTAQAATVVDGISVPVQSTYAERHANDPVKSTGSAIPEQDQEMGPSVAFRSTYADRHANDPVRSAGSAFPTPLDTSSD